MGTEEVNGSDSDLWTDERRAIVLAQRWYAALAQVDPAFDTCSWSNEAAYQHAMACAVLGGVLSGRANMIAASAPPVSMPASLANSTQMFVRGQHLALAVFSVTSTSDP